MDHKPDRNDVSVSAERQWRPFIMMERVNWGRLEFIM